MTNEKIRLLSEHREWLLDGSDHNSRCYKIADALQEAIEIAKHPIQYVRASEYIDCIEAMRAYSDFCGARDKCEECKYRYSGNCLAAFLYDRKEEK